MTFEFALIGIILVLLTVLLMFARVIEYQRNEILSILNLYKKWEKIDDEIFKN